MKKRSKIIALVTTLCLCLSMFTIGVLAATSASLSVTSTLNFEAKGVYVMVDASLKQGADVSTAQVLSGEGAPTGQTTYKAYSYPRMETGTTPDAPNGEPSTKHFVDSTGAQASTWAIGDINYTSANKVVVYEFMVYNYSNFEVIGTVEGISEALTSYTDQLSIATYTGTTSTDATATSSPIYTFSIPARTNETTPGVTCYKIVVTLNNFMNELATGQIEMNVHFEKAPEPVYDYFTYSGNTITGFSDKYLDLETKPETLVIPNTDAEGNDITTIKNGSYSSPTFQGLESSKVIIQEGITSVGTYAFKDCTTLTNVTLPSKLTSIGNYAFSGCSGLTGGLVIPEGVTSIGSLAFDGCSSLTSVSLPSSLTSIGDRAFYGCSSLTGELEIPKGVTSIGDTTFYNCSGLTSVSLPSSLTSIGSSAFQNCSSLTSVSLPSSLTSIGESAFYGCTNLQYNEYENGKYLGNSENKYVVLMDTVNTTFTEFTINANCKCIYDSAFYSCRSLTSITIPERVTGIGDKAFYGCSSLTSITIPEGVTSIGSGAFDDCSSLQITVEEGNANYSSDNGSLYNKAQTELIRGSGGVSTVTILDTVTSIEQYAFRRCISLSSVILPSSLTSIGFGAFEHCSSLTSIAIPEGVTSIGSYAFSSCSSLTSITIPEGVTSIRNYAFSGCSSLKYIQITGNLTSSYNLGSGTWVKTDSATEPTDWNTNVATSIPASDSIGFYHQKSAWESAT